MKSVPKLELACLTFGDVHLEDKVDLVEQTRPTRVTNDLVRTDVTLAAMSVRSSGPTWL